MYNIALSICIMLVGVLILVYGFKYKLYEVLTPSEEPYLPTGCMVVVKEQDSYKVGDILNYEDFGIEVHYNNNIPTYYSSVIFFSSGINTEEVCGILKQINTTGNIED
jgi:signal peptidase I